MTATSNEVPQDQETGDQESEQAEVKEETQQSLVDLKTSLIPDIAKKLYERFVKEYTAEQLQQQGITEQTIQEQLKADMIDTTSTRGGFMSWISRGQSIGGWMNKGWNLMKNFSTKNISLSLSRAWERLSGSTKDQIDNTIKEIGTALREIKDAVELQAYLNQMGIEQKNDPKKDEKKDKSDQEDKEDEGKGKENKKSEEKKSDQEHGKNEKGKDEKKSEEDQKKKEKSDQTEGQSADGKDEEKLGKEN